MSKYRNTVFYDFEPRFLFIFSSNYWHRLVLEILFPDHIFPKISKYRTENLCFLSTGKYYAPPHTKEYVEKDKEDRIQKTTIKSRHLLKLGPEI